MSIVTAARGIAEAKLSSSLPRRWRHVQAVAVKAGDVSCTVGPSERPLLLAAAWLHDIGYAPDLIATNLHALDGARWLRSCCFDERVAALVAHHSCAAFEAEESGLGYALRSEFSDEDSPLRDALWYADMTTGPDGQDLDVHERLAEIRRRYGPDHLVTRFWKRAEPTIVAVVMRVEERLAIQANRS